MSVTELGIGGMTCASCAAHVTGALRSVPGVQDASVNLATERATVLHGPEVQLNALIGAVEHAGYEAHARIDDDDEQREREAALARKRALLIFAIAFSIPTMILAMAVPDFSNKTWFLGALSVPVWALVGWEFHRGALAALRTASTTMDTLISLGSTAALAIGYFETASAIITLVYIGKYLEASAKLRSNTALRSLLELRPQFAARVRDDGSLEQVLVELVAVGDNLVVGAGERIPVDAIVLNGESTIDRSMLTGESLPEDVHAESAVEQGTINGDGTLTIRATAVGAGTELSRIIAVVRAAQGSLPPVQRLADRVSAIFVPIILTVAALTFAGWMMTHHSWSISLIAAVAVLVVACPCALGLATPTAIIAGVGRAARMGVLFKDASTLERAAAIDTVVFDKTGTLTQGAPAVTPDSPDAAIAIAAALEQGSAHPLARAVVDAAHVRALTVPSVTETVTARGFGVRGVVDGTKVMVGNARFLSSAGIALDDAQTTHAYVARDGALVGRIDFADTPRAQSRETVAQLRAMHIEAHLVSGDAPAPVESVARAAGITQSQARVTPEGKALIVDDLRAEGHVVAFVGDGINDAPALAKADVGFAMGGGTAVAIETAGAAILSSDPMAVPRAIALARATVRTIRQNLFWAFAYNMVLVPLAVAGIVTPVYAAAAMGVSSLFVVGNSLLLGRGTG